MSATEFQNLFAQSERLPSPVLKYLQNVGMEDFLRLGFPKVQSEEWRYTRLTGLENLALTLPALSENFTAGVVPDLGIPCYRAVFVDGHFSATLSQLPQNCIVMPLLEAAVKNPQVVERAYVQLQNPTHGLIALNNALASNGVVLHIEADQQLDKVLQLIFINTARAQHLLALRNVIELGERAKASIIEHHIGVGTAACFTNVINQIHLQPYAELKHIKIQQDNDLSYHLATTQVMQQAHSRYVSHAFALQGLFARNEIKVLLDEAHAACYLHGLYCTRLHQHSEQHTRVEHHGCNTTSEQLYKGILQDKSRAVFNGKIIVQPHAQRSNAKQYNRNLLLSSAAEIDTKPDLEIYADDVQCAHGATVGQLDHEAMYYLRARGLDSATAEHLLLAAFANEIVERLSEVKTDYFTQLVADYFGLESADE